MNNITRQSMHHYIRWVSIAQTEYITYDRDDCGSLSESNCSQYPIISVSAFQPNDLSKVISFQFLIVLLITINLLQEFEPLNRSQKFNVIITVTSYRLLQFQLDSPLLPVSGDEPVERVGVVYELDESRHAREGSYRVRVDAKMAAFGREAVFNVHVDQLEELHHVLVESQVLLTLKK